MTDAPGRNCPLRYRYGAAAIAGAAEHAADTLYVIGGLYGNLPALDAIEAIRATERGPVTLCFNGDFNWFNVDDPGFAEINRRVLRHDAIQGNVEAELGADRQDAGCGCAYPDAVDAAIVERSNRIHARLRQTALHHADLVRQLAALPMFARYRVGASRIGVVHGDADALAGWGFDVAALDDPQNQPWIRGAFDRADVEIFASTHTCLPALRSFDAGHVRWVINNGAAGMPNFSGTRYGLLTRISVVPCPVPAAYGARGGRQGNVHIDAVAIAYDANDWERRFLANWPAGSDAWLSYHARIQRGPQFSLDRAAASGRR